MGSNEFLALVTVVFDVSLSIVSSLSLHLRVLLLNRANACHLRYSILAFHVLLVIWKGDILIVLAALCGSYTGEIRS